MGGGGMWGCESGWETQGCDVRESGACRVIAESGSTVLKRDE